MRKTQRLDTILKRRGWVSDAQIQRGLQQQHRGGRRWGSTLVELGIITETQLAEALAEQFGSPVWDPITAIPDPTALKLLPGPWAKKHGVMPLAYDPAQRALRVAMSDPNNIVISDEVKAKTGAKVLFVLAAPQVSLSRLWKQYYGLEPEPGEITGRGLALEFGFSAGKPEATLAGFDAGEATYSARVLLWLSQPFVAKLLRSMLEFERCLVGQWDGHTRPEGQWDYLIYDDDNSLCHPESLSKLKREMPRLQLVSRPSWTTSILRSPLSYERMRDGYLQLAEMVRQWTAPTLGVDGRDASRYALAMARLLPLTPLEVDTLLVACELLPLIQARVETAPEREALARELGCPFPLAEVVRAATQHFNQTGMSPGQSAPEAPFTARVYAVVDAFMRERRKHPLKTIEDTAMMSELFRAEAGKLYDPMAVEALLRVVREEVLEGYLPPGPMEVMLVSDRPVDWTLLHLAMENEGWRVVIAGGGAEARTLSMRRKPDAVVWAASGAIEWVRWQTQACPGIANFLILEEFDSALARAALESGYEDVWAGAWDAGVGVAKLRRASRRPVSPSPRSEAVTGTLSQLSIIDMVQILSAGTRSVKIELHHGPDTANVSLWQGQIRFAESGVLRGEDAVYQILAWADATFAFSPLESMPEQNCHLPNEAILLEGCRRIDEAKHAGEPQGAAIP
jgi:CheY-like chemotaxis protein